MASGDEAGLLDRVERALGVPSRLINNATYERHVSVDTFTIETLRRHYQVNNEGTLGLRRSNSSNGIGERDIRTDASCF
ncbi:hypothetical protein [Exiguobacterium sp. SH31]|uniref:hypothetical protein n=1 Tax=Exiguobacterium sp. SH31 TaxID=1843183 RepID=UPI000A0432D9|nr:hypothetical protein [Exiguobacterium sp. SH31]